MARQKRMRDMMVLHNFRAVIDRRKPDSMTEADWLVGIRSIAEAEEWIRNWVL